ncbi:MAG: hypothetical protein HYT03_02950 [Candidatus Harrisonbacteria bacterium]|nr:hypothetical protein [Candidatus Harrisonbacteria bacterium]
MSAKQLSSPIIKSKNLALLLVIFIAGLLQSAGLLSVLGVKPNLLLVTILVAAFFADFVFYIFLILISVFALRFRLILEPESLFFAVIAIAAYFLGRRLPSQPILNSVFIIGIGSVLFNLLASPSFFFNNLALVAIELVYDLVLGILIFKIFESWLKTN